MMKHQRNYAVMQFNYAFFIATAVLERIDE